MKKRFKAGQQSFSTKPSASPAAKSCTIFISVSAGYHFWDN